MKSKMNPWGSLSAIHVYILVDYFLSYVFPSFWKFILLYPSLLGSVGAAFQFSLHNLLKTIYGLLH